MTDRILHEIVEPELNEDEPDAQVHSGIVVDTEATGLDETANLIEIAAIPFTYTDSGRITALGEPVSWLRDPGIPLPEDCRLITGLTDDDVRGQIVDEPALAGVVEGTFIVAHNARFDRGLVERELPQVPWVTGWGCSMADVDWLHLGCGTSRGLETLLMRRGWWYEGHRALSDCRAVLHLLADVAPDGRTFFAHLRERALMPEYRVDAIGSPYETKDALAARRYRWDAMARVWWKVVTDVPAETQFLSELYGGTPRVRRVDPRMRYSSTKTA